jgi:hypothetical protein
MSHPSKNMKKIYSISILYMVKEIEKEQDIYNEVDKLIKIILLSGRKIEITKAFLRLKCIITGNCICSFCPGTKNIDFVYEFSRCLVNTRVMQLIKERHAKSKRWIYIQPLYAELYNILFEDLNANVGILSNEELEDINCKFKISPSIISKTLAEISIERKLRKKNNKKLS